MSSMKSSLIQRLESLQISPKRSLGQNFLINSEVVEKILSSVRAWSPSMLVEVGPGAGALTDELQEMGLVLKLIELDSKFAEHWREQGLEVIEGDALKIDWKELQLSDQSVLVSNLPYQISSSLVIDRSMDRNRFEAMALMFQKEVAQRILAKPCHKDYGLLSVVSQLFWRIEKLCDVNPGSFFPPPQVASRVLLFKRIESEIDDPELFLALLKGCFAQRRKKLITNLNAWLKSKGRNTNLKEIFLNLGFSESIRAEELTPRQFRDLLRSLWES